MSLECAPLGDFSLSNYNTGLIVATKTKHVSNIFTEWNQMMNSENSKNLDTGDQIIFYHIINKHESVRIHTLHDTCNLRCHPVFNNNAFVWSPISLIHHHTLSQLSFKLFRLSISFPDIFELLNTYQSLVRHFNPHIDPFKPRMANVTKSSILGSFYSSIS